MKKTLLTLFCIVCLVSCNPARTGQPPEQTNDGWQTAGMDAAGMDQEIIRELVDRINDGTYQNIHSVLIVRDGKLVLEEYFDGYRWDYDGDQFRGEFTEFGPDTTHNLASVTKSFTSALIGIAIDRGFIPGVDEKAFSYFFRYSHLSDERKDTITLEHLLTMTSGLEWNGMQVPLGDRNNDVIQLFFVPDPIEYILAKPAIDEPGTAWYYNGGGTDLLGEVIRESTGLGLDDFSAEYLFAPLGITEYEWYHVNPDIIHAAGNLKR